MEYNLRVIHGSQKDFYGKARVREDDGRTTLISYQTEVCFIKNGKPFISGFHSNTTTRHIKEFLLQNGFKAENTKQMAQDYQDEETAKEEEKENEEKAKSSLKMVGMVAGLGDLFCNNQKEKNDWKARMLKAGLENKGLIMPEDWDSLPEAEKEKRLNGAIEQIA